MHEYDNNEITAQIANNLIACEAEGKDAVREKFLWYIDSIVHGMAEEEDLLCALRQRAEQLSETNAELAAYYTTLLGEFSEIV